MSYDPGYSFSRAPGYPGLSRRPDEITLSLSTPDYNQYSMWIGQTHLESKWEPGYKPPITDYDFGHIQLRNVALTGVTYQTSDSAHHGLYEMTVTFWACSPSNYNAPSMVQTHKPAVKEKRDLTDLID